MCCVYMDDQVTDASFADYLRELGADIDRNQVRRGVLYHVAIPSAFSAERRHQLARVLDLRKDKLARLTAAYSMVTGSQLVKGVLTAIWWLAPPPYPRKVTTSLVTGVEFIAKYMPEVNAVEMARRFQALVKPPRRLPDLGFRPHWEFPSATAILAPLILGEARCTRTSLATAS